MPEFLSLNYTDETHINKLCSIINDWAEKKGFNESPLGAQGQGEEANNENRIQLALKAEQIALMHSELSECLEYLRKKGENPMDDKVPELTGEEAEMADLCIRVFHYCGKHDIDLGNAIRKKHEFNITRSHKHGKNF